MRAFVAANGAGPTSSTTIRGRSTVVAPDAHPTTNIAGNNTALPETPSGSVSPASCVAVQIAASAGIYAVVTSRSPALKPAE